MGAVAFSRLGEARRAKDWANQAMAISSNDATVLYNVACVFSNIGEAEEAMGALERAVSLGFGHWSWIENDSDFDPLRNHPRYVALLAKKEQH
jgi:adenylate cyclase